MLDSNFFIGLITYLVIIALIAYLIRNIILWYFKIDVMVKQNDETNRLLKKIAENTKLPVDENDFMNS